MKKMKVAATCAMLAAMTTSLIAEESTTAVTYTQQTVKKTSAPLWWCVQYAGVTENTFDKCEEVTIEIKDFTESLKSYVKGYLLSGENSIFAPAFAGYQNLEDRPLDFPGLITFAQETDSEYKIYDERALENWDDIGESYRNGLWFAYENSGANVIIPTESNGVCNPVMMTYEPMDLTYKFKLEALDPDC